MNKIKMTDLVGQAYYKTFHSISKNLEIMHYWFKGGRGSLKSSFVAIFVIYYMTRAALNGHIIHCVALRKVKDTIKDSIYNNLLWAIDMLGFTSLWQVKETPMKLTLGECSIIFRGCANQRDYEKIKSIKFKKGFCRFAIFEELTEFAGYDEVLSINQSLFRGGDQATCFYMYNPPPSKNNWVNKECLIDRPNRLIHHSTYLDVKPQWLGQIFISEAEHLKVINPRKYQHMYLGNISGEGLEIYPDSLLEIRSITEQEIKTFHEINRGIDFGFAHATCYVECFYNESLETLYIFNEVYGYQMNNKDIYIRVYDKAGNMPIYADSAEPRTINELKMLGLNIYPCKKGKDSKSNGIKWLQDRAKIVIDKKRCPNIANDFLTYEYEKDKNGEIIHDYPDEPDGSAATRYAVEKIILKEKWRILK